MRKSCITDVTVKNKEKQDQKGSKAALILEEVREVDWEQSSALVQNLTSTPQPRLQDHSKWEPI